MRYPVKETAAGRLQDGQLTIGLDVGDRSSFYCVLNGKGEVTLEAKVVTRPEALKVLIATCTFRPDELVRYEGDCAAFERRWRVRVGECGSQTSRCRRR